MEEETREEVQTVSVGEGILALVNSQTELYFNTVDSDPKQANIYVRNIIALCDKYKTIYQVDEQYYATDKECETKLKVAEMEAENKLKIAKLEAESKVELAKIDAELRGKISEIDNNTKVSICNAENQTHVDIANAEMAMRKKEYILNIANAGLNIASKVAFAGVAGAVIKNSFALEFDPDKAVILGRSTGTKLAEKFFGNVLTKGIF